MSTPLFQPRLLHAASCASLLLQVTEHLFPNQKLFALSQDQRRIAANETQNLLLQVRWAVESKAFAELFATPPVGMDMAPPGTILGEKIGLGDGQKGQGGYI